jgi:hypothetical protein
MSHHNFRIRITSVGIIVVLLVTSVMAHPTAGVAARAAERGAPDVHDEPRLAEYFLTPGVIISPLIPIRGFVSLHMKAAVIHGADATTVAMTETTARTGDQAGAQPDQSDRPSATTCTVTSAADSGAGTLRQCLLGASANDTIAFDPAAFPPAAPVAITLASPLPLITLDGLTIDASDAGVILNGSGLLAGSGLVISGANGVVIRGLRIQSFPTDGVQLTNGARNTIIGGETNAARNVIGGNGRAGVALTGPGTNDNRVSGNYIGVNAAGSTAHRNVWGVLIASGAKNNIIGGAAAGARNLISGNRFGVQLEDSATTGNQVLGNFIGVNAAGDAALGNESGVVIGFGAQNNFVGGETPGAGNLISGNTAGVDIGDPGTDGNRVLGNRIGTDATGSTALGNDYGVVIFESAQVNVVGGATPEARNLISGNREFGVLLQGPLFSPTPTSGNQVLGNTIGLNAAGTARVGNNIGVGFLLGAKSNFVGGATPGEGNLISGNIAAGVLLQDSPPFVLGTTGNQVLGNRIGPDATGSSAISNTIGVAISFGAQNNVIGGEAALALARNVISGNSIGVQIQGAGTNGNQIKGNFIGLNATGAARLDNRFGVAIVDGAQNNVIGGTTSGARNVISGNADAGIVLQDPGTMGNQALGNFIGADLTGTLPLTNAVGIAFVAGATKNIIGGTAEGARNVISGNSFAGIQISGDATAENQIIGNWIGANATGAAALANSVGVLIAAGADNNQIGGAATGAGNLISGNSRAGVVIQDNGTTGNKVLGNAIGVNAARNAALPNPRGVAVTFGAAGNDVGGTQPGASNLIAGNIEAGVQFQDSGTSNNKVLSNTIGADAMGALPLGNGYGVAILGQASSNAVEDRNLIKHNAQQGVVIADDQTTGNRIQGNEIVSNTLHGVLLRDGASSNTIGVSNTIAYNGSYGVAISGAETLNNTITRNSIHHNAPPQIKFVGAPVPISDAGTCYSDLVESVSCPNCRVEFFAQPEPTIGGTLFLQSADAPPNGKLPFLSALPPGNMPYVFATVRVTNTTTSEFYTVLCPIVYAPNIQKDYTPPTPTSVAQR